MPLATTVNLPKHHKARFPDQCVVCGHSSPPSTVRIITGSIGWWTWLLWMFRKPFTVKAPACKFCAWRLHFQRLVSILLMIALVLTAMWWIWPMFADHIPRAARKWAMLGLGLVSILPQIIFEVFFPHPFDITAYSETVDYEFRDPELAMEFAVLNFDAENMKMS